jgi:hypothetical protein
MKNVDMQVKGSILTITVDLNQEFGKSGSGKSIVIASTEGNQTVPGTTDVKIGLNVYRKAE